MWIGSPHSVDETLLYEVIYVFTVLDQQNIYVILQSECWIYYRWIVSCSASSKLLENVRLKVGPKQAAHSLDGITDVVWRCDVDSMPAETLTNYPSLLVDEIVIRKLVVNLSLKMSDCGLALVLFIKFWGQKQARESYQLDVAPQVTLTHLLKMLEPGLAAILGAVWITAPTVFWG